MRVWRYVITVDAGGAPNFEPPATTMTLCKPRIRERARPGDLVIAFNGTALSANEPHSVRWAGVVSEVIPLETYWDEPRFQGKKPERYGGRRDGGLPDNIYRLTPAGTLEQVENETRGPQDVARDVGGGNALVFRQFWYFGSTAPVLPDVFGLRIAGGRRGHRRSDLSDHSWPALQGWLDGNKIDGDTQKSSAGRGACGPPSSQARTSKVRHGDQSDATIPFGRRRC
jgi:hypothetical protein